MASNEKGAGNRRRRGSRNGTVSPADAARIARGHLAQLTGRPIESVLGLHRDDDGWKVTVEVVELSRIPNSTDLLGCYVVEVDDDGELVGYSRNRRYHRNQADED